jgi:hypothetical protein
MAVYQYIKLFKLILEVFCLYLKNACLFFIKFEMSISYFRWTSLVPAFSEFFVPLGFTPFKPFLLF